MTLISIHGPLGSGKTLFLTWWTITRAKEGFPAYANYEIKIPNFKALLPEMLVDINTRCTVSMHEAYAWLESRHSSMSAQNQYFSYILFSSRKRGIDWAIDDQLLSSIDVRFRLLTDIEVLCARTKVGFKYYIRTRDRCYTAELKWEDAKKIFPYYNTYEDTHAISKDLIAKIAINKKPMLEEVNNIVDELLTHAPANKFTHAVIDDYCRDKGYGPQYNDMIYDRIKSRAVLGTTTKMKKNESTEPKSEC